MSKYELTENGPDFFNHPGSDKKPNVDYELLKEYFQLSLESDPFSKGANYRITSPFETLHIAEHSLFQSALFKPTQK